MLEVWHVELLPVDWKSVQMTRLPLVSMTHLPWLEDFIVGGTRLSLGLWICSKSTPSRALCALESHQGLVIKSQITCSDSEFGEGKQSFIQTVKTVALLQNYQFTTYVTLYEVKAWHKTSSQGFLLPPFIWKVFRISWSFWFPIGYLKSCLPLGVKERPYQP